MDLHLSQWSGAELIDVELKALLIFVLACCLAAMSRKAAASTRHAIWLAAIVLLITLPIAGLALPEFSLPLLPSTPIDVDGAVKATALDSKELSLPAAAWEATSGWVVALSLFVNAWSRFALVIWATGFFLLMVRAAVGLIRLDGLRRSAEAVDDAGWQTLLATAKIQAGVRRDVELMVSPGVRTPFTWGLQRIHICLPAHADQWSMMNRRIVLAHELAHARRGDWLWQLLSIAMTSLHWFNPLAWCSAHRMRMEAEIACDDEVIMRGCAPSAYADCLYQMVRAAKATPLRLYAAVPMARPSELPARMTRILDKDTKRFATTFRTLNLTWVISIMVGSVFAAASVVRVQPPNDDHGSTPLELPLAGQAQAMNPDTEAAPKPVPLEEKPTAQHLVAKVNASYAPEKAAVSPEKAGEEVENPEEELWENDGKTSATDLTKDTNREPSEKQSQGIVSGETLTANPEGIDTAPRSEGSSQDEGTALSAKLDAGGDKRHSNDAQRRITWHGLYASGEWPGLRPQLYRVEAEFLRYTAHLIDVGLDSDQVNIAMGLITERTLLAKIRNTKIGIDDGGYAQYLQGRARFTRNQTRIVLEIGDRIAFSLSNGLDRI